MKLEVTKEFMEYLIHIENAIEVEECDCGNSNFLFNESDIFKKMPPQSEDMYLIIFGINPYLLAYMEDQTEEACLAAVSKSGNTLTYVKKQTEKICLAAVSQDPSAFQYVQEEFKEACRQHLKEVGDDYK